CLGAEWLYAVNRIVISIRLHVLLNVADFMGLQLQGGIDLVEGGGAVGLRLAGAEQVEVRSMQNENRGQAWLPLENVLNCVECAANSRFRCAHTQFRQV